jgi:broad specificity phosphatase PhoE
MELQETEDMMMKNNMTTIYIVRHGQSQYNELANKNSFKPGMWGERGDQLTTKGREQVKEIAKQLQKIHFDAIFSSDLARATQTAEIIKLGRELTVQTRQTIRERLSYIFPGKSIHESEEELKELIKNLDNKAKMAYKLDNNFESTNETAARMITFLREIAVAYRNQTVLVVNHGNICVHFCSI